MKLLESTRERLGYRLPKGSDTLIRYGSRFIKPSVDVELFPNIRVELDLSDDVQRAAFCYGDRYEYPTCKILRNLCKANGSVFFDIGSNFGFYSYYLLSIYSTMDVYSFEPLPTCFAQQIATKSRNGLQHFFPSQIGLSNTEATLSINVAEGKLGVSTFGQHPRWSINGVKLDVPVLPFDRWMVKQGISLPISPIWVAKIDVEGYEKKVLEGMAEALKAQVFNGLCVEINKYTLSFCETTNHEIYNLLGSFGYRAYDENFQETGPIDNELRNVFFFPY